MGGNFKTPQSKRELRTVMLRSGCQPAALQTQYSVLQNTELVVQKTSLSDASSKWEQSLFHVTLHEMAVCVFGGWESGKEVTGSSLVLKNGFICLRASFSWVGNNPSLRIHSICENRAKCYWMCDPTDEVFSSVLMRQDLHVADSSYLPYYEAYERSLALSSHLLLTPCGEGEPKQQHFLAVMFIKRRFWSKQMCRHCCMLSWYCLQFMIYHASSLGVYFHIHIAFGSNVLFSHIFSVLHHNSMETCWFSHVLHESPLTEEISMHSS